MVRMMTSGSKEDFSILYWVLYFSWHVRKISSQFTRHCGEWIWYFIILMALNCIGVVVIQLQDNAISSAEYSLSIQKNKIDEAKKTQMKPSKAEDSIKAFEGILVPYEDIPDTVRSVLQLAEDEGLSIERGEYRAEPEQNGRYLRYKMNLPVKGRSSAIYKFMRAVLLTHGNLTLDGLQFKRESIGSEIIEAKIQWIVLSHLPKNRVQRLP
ncbi:hypothetical protein [Acinetobacter sp.]|uniref:hypothetical protein n=1 Tax=Acinetobacter sp. TaxID=472 RepID=UPI0035B48590